MNIQFFNFEILEVSQEQKPMTVRTAGGQDVGRHLNRKELATMSNLDKRLKGKRVGPQEKSSKK